MIDEDLAFSDESEFSLSDKEAKDLLLKLLNMEVDDQTKMFFKTTKEFYRELEDNSFVISLKD